MKRKLSGSEASSPEGVGQSSVDEQAQPSSTLELEQGAVSAEARGFILEPNLALSLGMRPGEMIFRSMFYGSPQASNVSVLVNQLLEKQEELFNCGPGEGTSSGTHYNTLKTLSLIESNAAAIQALMDSVEAPTSAPVPEVVEGEDNAHWQAPIAPEQSTGGSDGGFILAPDLALSLGMQPGQALLRGMFYGTSQSDTVLIIVNQLSEIREDLLRNQERSGAIEGGTNVDFEDTSSLVETNEELIKALMGSIEAPAVPTTAVEEPETEPEEKSPAELEEERDRELAELKAKLEMKEQAKAEKLRDEEAATKSREKDLEKAISIAVCREANLERVKDKVKEDMERLEVMGSLRATKRNTEKMKARERELRRVVAEPRPENLRKMERELNEAIAKCKELEKAGAVETSIAMDYVRTKETKIGRDLKEAKARETKVKNLEEELKLLVAREMCLEKMETSKRKLDEVRKKKTNIESDINRLKATIATAGKSIETELGKLMEEKKEIKAKIDRGKREMELNILKMEAKARPSKRELELMLRLKGISTKVRALELKLGLWLSKITARKSATVQEAIQESIGDSDEGFVLAPDLAQSLGMQPDQMLRRGMFYGTAQSDIVLSIINQLLAIREDLLRDQELERSGANQEGTSVGCEDAADLIVTNRELIQALMGSIEEPGVVVPTVVPKVIQKSKGNSDEGFMLAPDLAQSLGMQPDQMLRRGMFYGTTQSDIVLNIVNQLLAIREDLLRDQELERSGANQEGNIVDCEDAADLIVTNGELIQALMGSIEAPEVAVPIIEVEESETESEEEAKLEGEKSERLKRSRNSGTRLERLERLAKLAESKAKMEMQEKEKLRKKEEETAARSQERPRKKEKETAETRREKEIRKSISTAVRREAELEKIKEYGKDIMKKLEVLGSLISRKKDINTIKETEKKLRKVLAETGSEDLQEMEKELDKVRSRYEELQQAGARNASMEIGHLRTKEEILRKNLEEATKKEMEAKNLEKELALVARELDLEKMGSSELGEVTTRMRKVEEDLLQLRTTIAATGRSVELELELGELIKKRGEIEADINMRKREMELSRLKMEAKVELGRIEIELLLRLEWIKTRIRVLELELGLWLRKIEMIRF
ncbi:hypothetical protein [Candidatus Ichthyocystis sparus]|uniref:hypothetical protein n=1 Tax=Candidatus Ichthyocystis sparus TaxID=1561004 RepID=UPI000B844EDC|nr:hypothetical protein [Candidatus Ichthyocystis sparus]